MKSHWICRKSLIENVIRLEHFQLSRKELIIFNVAIFLSNKGIETCAPSKIGKFTVHHEVSGLFEKFDKKAQFFGKNQFYAST